MSIYSIRQRWGMGPRVDPHFDARVGRIAASPKGGPGQPAHGSGYIELDGSQPWEDLRAFMAMVYGDRPPGAGPLYDLLGALGAHQRPLVWTQVTDIRYLTTDPACGVALPMRDFMRSGGSRSAEQAIRRLAETTGGRLQQARVIGLTVTFDFEVLASRLQAALNPGALRRLFGGGGPAASASLLFGGPRRAMPLGRFAAGLAGARRYGAQHFGVSGTSSPQLAMAMRLLQCPPPPTLPADYGIPETGAGTIVGIVDFGCDFAHPSFRRQPAGSRILALWDQNGDPQDHPPIVHVGGQECSFGYGRLVRREDIERVLQEWQRTAPQDAEFPYRELRYDPHRNHYTAHAPGEDGGPDGAHGTFVMEAAAGSHRTAGVPVGAPPPCGLACEADIVFVQVRQRPRPDGRRVLDMNDVIDAVAFIFHTAEESNRPCVVNLSLNTMSGPHDGDGYFERRLASLLRSGRAGPDARGRAVVVAAGNLPGSDVEIHQWQHVGGEVSAGNPVSFHWLMPAQDRTRNVVEIWYDADQAWLQLTLESQDGQKIGPVKPGQAVELMLADQWRGTVIGSRLMPKLRANGVLGPPAAEETDESPGRHVILLELEPAPQAQVEWKVILELAPDTQSPPLAGAKVKFDAWLERDDDGPSGLCRHHPAQPIEDPDRHCTVGTLSCGSDAIVVGAYSTFYRQPEPWGYSGHGPNRRGDKKPDLAAPGHFLTLVRSRHGNDAQGTLTRASGTSVAAPFVTGTIACVYQRKPDATLQEVRSALIETAVPLNGEVREWATDLGHGCLHPAGVLARFR